MKYHNLRLKKKQYELLLNNQSNSSYEEEGKTLWIYLFKTGEIHSPKYFTFVFGVLWKCIHTGITC